MKQNKQFLGHLSTIKKCDKRKYVKTEDTLGKSKDDMQLYDIKIAPSFIL